MTGLSLGWRVIDRRAKAVPAGVDIKKFDSKSVNGDSEGGIQHSLGCLSRTCNDAHHHRSIHPIESVSAPPLAAPPLRV